MRGNAIYTEDSTKRDFLLTFKSVFTAEDIIPCRYCIIERITSIIVYVICDRAERHIGSKEREYSRLM